jgi:acetyl-CoA carboxylase biotin carboxyl carrier protein
VSLGTGDLEQIMKLFEQSNFSELKLKAGDLELHLRKDGALPRATAAARAPAAPEPVMVAPSAPAAHALPPLGPGEIDVLSPLLGVYYRAPKPGEPAFVEVGQAVEADTIIGIVEVMKLMNSVRAGTKGVIAAIHVANADMVEFEQPLVRIRTYG